MRARLDEVDDAEQQELAVPELEYIADADRRGDVGDAEVVAVAWWHLTGTPITPEA